MSHEGRMRRGEEKHNKGVVDSETEYFLSNTKEAEIVQPDKPKKSKSKGSK
tara:strand:- start:440 stop:592 length:153 start_codon:yes stop_codon:yes gene_type:complete